MSFLKKITGIFGGEATAPQRNSSTATPKVALEPLDYLRNAAGRVPLLALEQAASQLSKNDFCKYVGVPSLVGSAVHEGHVTSRAFEAGNRKKTFVFIPTEVLEDSENTGSADTLQRAVYPLIRDQKKLKSETANSLSIGRDTECDISMPDTAISERQARIYVSDSDYSLHDTNSTNGTWLNGERLGSNPVLLSDRAAIRFARYEFTFVSPESLYTLLRSSQKL